jgi:hypothetical protein
MAMTETNLVAPKAAAKHELFVQQTYLRGQFIEQRLMLSSSFGVNKFKIVTGINFVTLCCAT